MTDQPLQRRPCLVPALAALVAVLATPVAAQDAAKDWPNRPVTMVVPFPAGGGVDAIGRIVAAKLADALGQQVVVDNRPGAGGVIGTRAARTMPADGYTLVMATSGTVGVNPNLYAKPGYAPLKDFAPIGLISYTPIVLMAHPQAQHRTLKEVIAAAKAAPGKLDIGTPPPGTMGNLAAELFKSMAGIDFAIVPFRGTGPLTAAVAGGHVPLAFNVIAPAIGQLKGGGLDALAVLAPKRSGLLPDVPTSAEAGLPGFEAGLSYGLLAPAGTPRPIIERLNAALRALVEAPDVRARISSDGGDPMPSSPEDYAADIEREDKRWGVLIRKLGLKVEG